MDYMTMALHSIRSRRLRSWLTILGIVVGVTAVVALIAIGQGMKRSVEKQFEAIGYDTIMMYPGGLETGGPGGGGGGRFFGEAPASEVLNLEALRKFPQVEKVGFIRIETAMVKSAGFEGQGLLRVTGLSPGITADFHGYFREFPLGDGRGFQADDQFVAIMGHQVATNLKVSVGDEIEVDQKKLKVVGILAAVQGGRGGFGAGGLNNALYIPIKTMEAMYQKEGSVSMALLKAAKGTKIAEVAQRVKGIMNRQGTPVSTITAEEISQRVSGALGTVQMTLIAIAAISLLVGAIGVMNTMFTSVLERTREIGILKAVGAKDRHVLNLFLIESGLMGTIGGVLGILCGVAISLAAGQFVGRMLSFGPIGEGSFSAYFGPELIIGALAFSFVLGAISGTLPARQAAQLRPIEALRYE